MSMKPDAGPLSELSNEEFDQFILCLGRYLFNSIEACALARHQYPADTMRDYFDKNKARPLPGELARQYLIDIVERRVSIETLTRKWFVCAPDELFEEVSGDLAKRLK